MVQVRRTATPDEPPKKGWAVFHAEGPTWLIVFCLVASIGTVVALLIILGGQ